MIEKGLAAVERQPFGVLLRRRRLIAGLSQEQLAERSRISVQAVSALERGVRYAPRPDTLALLSKTLDLAGDDRDEFERVARASVKQRVRRAHFTVERQADAVSWAGPVFADAFFGRVRERAEIRRALRSERCVTIWGAGGVGKTRVVVETLRGAGYDASEDIVFVSLATAIGDGAVAAAVAEALDITDTGSQDDAAAVVAVLGDRRTVLVLDNCEHVVNGVSTFVEALLARSHAVTVVCTSRERLRIASEHVVQIGPLEQSDSVSLFGDRARLDGSSAESMSMDVTSVATICRRLDGVPLAVELAAARVPSLGVAQIERALDERFALLTRGRRTDAARHRTLRATIAWSYALLSPVERIVFERVALINGWFSLDDAIAISIDGTIERWGVVDAIAGLVEKAMLSVADADDRFDRPYLLLESTRAFAMSLRDDERADPDLDAGQRRFGLSLLSRIRSDTRPYPDDLNTFEGIDADAVRGFLHWAVDEGRDPRLGALVIGFLRNFWDNRGLYSEGLRWSESVLRLLPDDAVDNEPKIQALRCASAINLRLGRYVAAMDALKAAYALAKRGEHTSLYLWTTVNLAKSAAMTEDHDLARERADEALALFDRLGDASGRPGILTMQAFVAMQAGNLDQARDAYMKLVIELDANGAANTRLRNQTLVDLAEIEYGLGNFAQAVAIGRRNVITFGEENMSTRLSSLSNLCIYLVCSKLFDEAKSYALSGLRLARETGNTLFVAMIAQACAMMAVYRADRIDVAAEIFGWTSRLFGAGDLDIFDRMTRDRLKALLTNAMSEEALTAAIQRGELLREDDVATMAHSLVR